MIGALLTLLACGLSAEEVAIVANPMMSMDREIDRTPWTAEVRRTRPAGPYAYLSLETPERTVWVVGLDKTTEVGQAVSFSPFGRAKDFESARTGDRYDVLWFGIVRPVIAEDPTP